jgi:DNA modification methylase
MKLILGDCLEKLKELPENSVDAVITDPPYGLSFMGKKWDYDVPSQEIWEECLRVLKPGGYLLAFAGTRTQHRMAVRIEDAGFEIRDMIAWVYGSGFPKSLNIAKAVDKLQGNEREDLGENDNQRLNKPKADIYKAGIRGKEARLTKGTSEWKGWGTALKPALEPITVARKPLSEKTVAENCLKWGVGGINIDGCRVGHNEPEIFTNRTAPKSTGEKMGMFAENGKLASPNQSGRFPANLIHDGSDEVVSLFPNCKATRFIRRKAGDDVGNKVMLNSYRIHTDEMGDYNDNGSASRFFYCAKASKSERNRGCEELEEKVSGGMAGTADQTLLTGSGNIRNNMAKNNHPTVKPIALMEYLVKLISREGATILDPFMGSGSTALACKDRNFIGIEKDPEYFKIAENRINNS